MYSGRNVTDAKGGGSAGSFSNYAFSFGNLGGSGSRGGSSSPTSLAQQKSGDLPPQAQSAAVFSSSATSHGATRSQPQVANPRVNIWGGEASTQQFRPSTQQQSGDGAFSSLWSSASGVPSKTSSSTMPQTNKPPGQAGMNSGVAMGGADNASSIWNPLSKQSSGTPSQGAARSLGAMKSGVATTVQQGQQRRGDSNADDVFAGLWGGAKSQHPRQPGLRSVPSSPSPQQAGGGRSAEPSLRQLRKEATGGEGRGSDTTERGPSDPAILTERSQKTPSSSAANLSTENAPRDVPGGRVTSIRKSASGDGGDPFAFISGDLGPPPSKLVEGGNGVAGDDPFGFLGIPGQQQEQVSVGSAGVEEVRPSSSSPLSESLSKDSMEDSFPPSNEDSNFAFEGPVAAKAEATEVGTTATSVDPFDFMFGGGSDVSGARAETVKLDGSGVSKGAEDSFDFSWNDDTRADRGKKSTTIAPPPRPRTSISATSDDDFLRMGNVGSSMRTASSKSVGGGGAAEPSPDTGTQIDPSMELFADLFGGNSKSSSSKSAGVSSVPVGMVDFDSPWGDEDAAPVPAGSEDHLEGVPPPPPGLSMAGTKERGDGFYKGGQFGDAIKYYSWAVAIWQRTDGKDATAIVEVLLNRAMSYKEAGDCRKAVDDCSKVLELLPTSVLALEKRAFLYESMEKYKLGAADFKKILELDSSHREAIRGLGRLQKTLRALGE